MTKILTVLQPFGWTPETRGKLVSSSKTIIRTDDGTLKATATFDGHATYYRATQIPFVDFDGMVAALEQAVSMNAGIVHGELTAHAKPRKMRRGHSQAVATLADRACPYLIVDIDSLEAPAGMSIIDQPEECARFALTALPAELGSTSCFFQYSGSAGLSGKRALKLHLVFMLDGAYTVADLKRYVLASNEVAGTKVQDPAVLTPSQIVYLAPPVLSPGVEDPFGARRTGIIKGERDAAVLTIPSVKFVEKALRTARHQQPSALSDAELSGVGVKGIGGNLKLIGPNGLHDPMRQVVTSAVFRHGTSLDRAALKGRIVKRIQTAVAGGELNRDAVYIASEVAGLDRMIDWSMDLRNRSILEAPYGAPAPALPSVEAAQLALAEGLAGFFARCDQFNASGKGSKAIDLALRKEVERLEGLVPAFNRQLENEPKGTGWYNKTMETLAGINQDIQIAKAKRKAHRDATKAAELTAFEGAPGTAPIMLVKATTGAGKTSGTLSALVDSWQASVHMYVPTHATAEEIAESVRKLQMKHPSADRYLEPLHLYGRTHKDAKTERYTMCQRGEAVSRFQNEGGDVGRTFCGTEEAPLCPHFHNCPFQKQAAKLRETKESGERLLYVMATDTLPHWLPGGVRKPELVIIDEAFFGSLVSTAFAAPATQSNKPTRAGMALALSSMAEYRPTVLEDVKEEDRLVDQVPDPVKTAQFEALWRKLCLNLMEINGKHRTDAGWFPINALTVTPEELKATEKLLKKCRVSPDLAVRPGMSDGAIKKAMEAVSATNETVRVYKGLVSALILEAQKPGELLTAAVGIVDGFMTYRRAIEPSSIGRTAEARAQVPTLLLDADADPDIVRRWWPHLTDADFLDVTCPWSEAVKVVQVVQPSFSKDWLISGKAAPQHQKALLGFIRHVMRLNGVTEDETMLITYKAAIEALAASGDPLFAPESTACGNFNNIAGRDSWKHSKVGFVVGRPQANASDYEDIARAVWAGEARTWKTIEPDGEGRTMMPKEMRRLHMRDGSLEAVHTAVHPDGLVQKAYSQVTTGQVMQSDGRIRPVHRSAENPALLVILGDVPRGIAVDKVVKWEDIEADKFDEAVRRAWACGGICPTSDQALSDFAPDLWPTAKAVKDARRAQGEGECALVPLADLIVRAVEKAKLWKGVASPYKTPIGRSDPLIQGEIRKHGQRGSGTPFLRLHRNHDLATAIFRTFGTEVATVKLSTGEWVSIDDLPIESNLPAHLAQVLKADLAEILHGVFQPALADLATGPTEAQLRLHQEALDAFSRGDDALAWQLVGASMLDPATLPVSLTG